MTNAYDDIIHLPHPVSATRPRMSMSDRAAQFSPFAALTGYDAAIRETARLTGERILLDESVKEALRGQLRVLAEHGREHPEITVTYFLPDAKKTGGAYVTAIDTVKKMDEQEQVVVMTDGTKIPMEDILSIEGPIFESMA